MTLLTLPHESLILKTDKRSVFNPKSTIDDMCEHIMDVGLLNPLTVTKLHDKYLIIDGAKRLQAIRKLGKTNKLPRELHKIPCTLNDNTPPNGPQAKKPLLLNDQDLAHQILRADLQGHTYAQISALLDCSEKVITQARCLKQLHPKIMLAFINRRISLSQAAALSTLPNKDAQWTLFLRLGPFVTEPQIIAAIAKGETVIHLPDGDTMILPSRATNPIFSHSLGAIFPAHVELAA